MFLGKDTQKNKYTRLIVFFIDIKCRFLIKHQYICIKSLVRSSHRTVVVKDKVLLLS